MKSYDYGMDFNLENLSAMLIKAPLITSLPELPSLLLIENGVHGNGVFSL